MAPNNGPNGRPPRRVKIDWQILVPQLVHSTKVVIIEAMLCIERPLSATELATTTNGTVPISSMSYHLNRLAETGALEVVTKLKARKTQGSKREKFFYFSEEHDWASQVARKGDLVDPLLGTALSIAASIVTIGGSAAGII